MKELSESNLVPPVGAKLIEWPTSIMWFDEHGILYSVPKQKYQVEQTREESIKQMNLFRELVGNKKVCMVLESNYSSKVPNREDRDWIAKELESVTKAMAIISNSPLSRMVANLFFGIKPPSYPVKFFGNQKDAKDWILQYV